MTLICPTCDLPAANETRRVKRHLVIADAICPNEHLWQAKWLLPAIPLDEAS